MADTLLKAIHRRFTNAGLSGTITGGLWTSEVPEDTELPYCAVFHEGTQYEHMMRGGAKTWVEHSRASFHIYAAGAENAEVAGDAVLEAFTGGTHDTLPYHTKRCCHCLIDSMSVTPETVRYRDGSLVYCARLVFDILVSKDV